MDANVTARESNVGGKVVQLYAGGRIICRHWACVFVLVVQLRNMTMIHFSGVGLGVTYSALCDLELTALY